MLDTTNFYITAIETLQDLYHYLAKDHTTLSDNDLQNYRDRLNFWYRVHCGLVKNSINACQWQEYWEEAKFRFAKRWWGGRQQFLNLLSVLYALDQNQISHLYTNIQLTNDEQQRFTIKKVFKQLFQEKLKLLDSYFFDINHKKEHATDLGQLFEAMYCYLSASRDDNDFNSRKFFFQLRVHEFLIAPASKHYEGGRESEFVRIINDAKSQFATTCFGSQRFFDLLQPLTKFPLTFIEYCYSHVLYLLDSEHIVYVQKFTGLFNGATPGNLLANSDGILLEVDDDLLESNTPVRRVSQISFTETTTL